MTRLENGGDESGLIVAFDIRRGTVMSCVQVTVLTLIVAAPGLKESIRPLLGQWICTGKTFKGEAIDLPVYIWDFAAGGKLSLQLRDLDPAERRYLADPTKSPAHLDWTDGEDTIEAIYKVEGDMLTVCYSHDPSADRPSRFESPKGTRLILITFKRVKQKD
jgi:uncharacterized protein (TIGR03067 family)